MMRKVTWLLIGLVGVVLGYGGFGFKMLFVNSGSLKQWLNEFNREWGGSDSFLFPGPLWWLEGHGRGQTGPVTLGGGGAITYCSLKSDSLGTKIAGVSGGFKLGYPIALNPRLEVQPNVDLGLNNLLVFVHSLEPGMSNFNRWFLTWGFHALPAVMVAVRFRSGVSSYIGFYVNGGYLLPLGSQNRYGNEPAPAFSARGWSIDAGIVFGRTVPKPFRI
ncbi:MAG: hypothetical protein ACP5JB_00565 [candidate division WOR-3 bacterium]